MYHIVAVNDKSVAYFLAQRLIQQFAYAHDMPYILCIYIICRLPARFCMLNLMQLCTIAKKRLHILAVVRGLTGNNANKMRINRSGNTLKRKSNETLKGMV